jgi:hypothetical protein
MRTKQFIQGFNNKQRVRAIINGVGFYATVQDLLSGPFSDQTTALHQVLHSLNLEKSTGIGTRVTVYNYKMEQKSFDIQLDLV